MIPRDLHMATLENNNNRVWERQRRYHSRSLALQSSDAYPMLARDCLPVAQMSWRQHSEHLGAFAQFGGTDASLEGTRLRNPLPPSVTPVPSGTPSLDDLIERFRDVSAEQIASSQATQIAPGRFNSQGFFQDTR